MLFLKPTLLPALIGSLLLVLPEPVVRRHDRPDADYQKLALGYPEVCHVGLDGVGVLIAPRWILTAAHVARDLTFFEPRVRFLHEEPSKGRRARVDRVILHPGFVMTERRIDHDFALLRLAEPIEDLSPTPILRKAVEAGALMTLVGDGDLGTGKTGATQHDGRWRGATNRPSEIREHALLFRFEAPGEEGCTEMEGFWGPGDSGTPAFLQFEGQRYVAGIGSHGRSGPDGKVASYGAIDLSYRVSFYADWIDAMTSEHARTEPTIRGALDPDSDAFAESPYHETVAAYFETLPLDDPSLRRIFVDTFATEAAGAGDAQDVWPLRRLGGHRSQLQMTQVSMTGAGVDALARSGSGSQGFVFRFAFEGDDGLLASVRVIPVLLEVESD